MTVASDISGENSLTANFFPSDSYSLLLLKIPLSLRCRAWLVDASSGAGHNLYFGRWWIPSVAKRRLLDEVLFLFYIMNVFPPCVIVHHVNDGSH